MVQAHDFNRSTWEAETGRTLEFEASPAYKEQRLHRETLRMEGNMTFLFFELYNIDLSTVTVVV